MRTVGFFTVRAHGWARPFTGLGGRAPGDPSEAASPWMAPSRGYSPTHRATVRCALANPERWPGYYLVRQRAIALGESRRAAAAPWRGRAVRRAVRRRLAEANACSQPARGGPPAGRISSTAPPSPNTSRRCRTRPGRTPPALSTGTRRQLRLYSVLIGEMGSWPATARIVAAPGQVLEEPVHRPACEAEADAAISGLDAMNHALSTDTRGRGSGESWPSGVRTAPLSWGSARPSGHGVKRAHGPELLEPAARGTLLSVDPGLDGDLYAVNVRLDRPLAAQVATSR